VEDKKHIRTVIALALSLMLGACAGTKPYDKDRPYDPDIGKGETLFDQIPNWEGEALQKCAGHIPPEQRKPWQSGRC
jgi:hypothetical protein